MYAKQSQYEQIQEEKTETKKRKKRTRTRRKSNRWCIFNIYIIKKKKRERNTNRIQVEEWKQNK